MNSTRWLALAAVVLVVGFGWWWMRSHDTDGKPRFRTVPVERGYVETVVSATGTVNPVEQVEVGSQVSGTVSKLYADYNSRVKQGQVLLQIEPSSFQARLAQSEAAVARAEAALKDADRQLKRSRELLASSNIAQADVETAEITVDQRRADLKQANAVLQSSQVDLANTTIKAPIDGVVISRAIDLGQTVAASLQAPKLFVIANDLTQMQVETRIDEADIGPIHPGLPVLFTVDAFPEESFTGTVAQVRLEPITEQNVVTYTTVIRTANPDLKLRPGMTANVSVRIASRDDVLKVPNSALRFHPPAEKGSKSSVGQSKRAGIEAPVRTRAAAFATAAFASATAGRGGAVFATADWSPAAGHGVEARFAADEKKDDLGRADLEKRMKDRGMPDDMIKTILERRDQMIEDMRKQGMSDEEIRERLRQRMQQMRDAQNGGAAPGSGMSFRDLDRQKSAASDSANKLPAGRHMKKKGAGAAPQGAAVVGGTETPTMKPGAVYVLQGGHPVRVSLMTGISDGAYTEVASDQLKAGDQVIVGLETTAKGAALTPPPGMGGPFGGGGNRGGGGGSGGRGGR